MKELFAGEEPRAICYLREEGNSNNMVALTSIRLVVIQKGKEFEFYIDAIQKLTFNHRKQILLVIFGGISAPLATVALFGNLFNPLILLLFIISGLFAFYIGWMGNPVLTINLIGDHHDFLIQNISENLTEFVEFTNHIILSGGKGELLFFIPIPQGQTIDETIDKLKHKSRTRLLTTDMLKNDMVKGYVSGDQLCIGINPFRAEAEIRYEKSAGDGIMIPFMTGKLNKESIVRSGRVTELL